jgi:acyl carrier protein
VSAAHVEGEILWTKFNLPRQISHAGGYLQTLDQTLAEVLTLAANHFKVPREKLAADDDFFKTLGIDSLQALDLLTKLEHHFHIELPDYELQGVSDFRTLASRIQARL